jgi:hypothetical protein
VSVERSDYWNWPDLPESLEFSTQFGGLDATVGEFWQWGFSDLRMNIVRGVLAEFLVHKAVGATQSVRNPWDNYDVLAPDGARGIKVEVKSSGYLQSWPQKRPSRLSFGGLRALEQDPVTWALAEEPTVRAEVVVFAAHLCDEPEPGSQYPMTDLSWWSFWVAPGATVDRSQAISLGIEWVREHAEPCEFEALEESVARAAAEHRRLTSLQGQ